MSRQSSVHKPPRERERFSRPGAVIGVFVSFLFVLMLLYPERGLMGILSAAGDDTAAVIRYREALLRIRPGNNELRLNVAGSLIRTGRSGQALVLLDDMKKPLNGAEVRKKDQLCYQALLQLAIAARPGSAEWLGLKVRLSKAAVSAMGEKPYPWQLRVMAEDARKAGDFEAAADYLRRAEAGDKQASSVGGDEIDQAIWNGNYKRASEFCFAKMKMAGNVVARRGYFIRGVKALQAGNQPLEAFRAGERHLGSLAGDRETLLFMTRAGMAAGQPQRAQFYIRRLLGMGMAEES